MSKNEFDFGFTSLSEEEINEDVRSAVEDANERVTDMYNMILPLLHNLSKDNKDYIYWPNRAETIKEFAKKLKEIKDA